VMMATGMLVVNAVLLQPSVSVAELADHVAQDVALAYDE